MDFFKHVVFVVALGSSLVEYVQGGMQFRGGGGFATSLSCFAALSGGRHSPVATGFCPTRGNRGATSPLVCRQAAGAPSFVMVEVLNGNVERALRWCV